MMEDFKKLNGKNPFKIPENYFEEINEKILSNTIGLSDSVIKKSKFTLLLTFSKIAAILSGVVIISFLTLKFLKTENDKNLLSGVTLNEITLLDIDDFDEFSLEESLLQHEPELSIEVSKSDIIDYLTNEDLNLSDIIELL